MSPTGVDETVKLEAVYFSTPIPRNLAALTVLAAVFDKIYFPGVFIPKEGYDPAELDKEIARLESAAKSENSICPIDFGRIALKTLT
jgi:hypothetical protein